MVNFLAIGTSLTPNIGGWVGGYVTSGNMQWYETLKKPSWRPPNWVFGPVWTGLYTGMGYASYLVYKEGGGFNGPARYPLMLYGGQLALNWAWSPIFFGAHKLKWSLIDICALWATTAACGCAFYKVDKVAGYIFIPYILWLTLATSLNYVIYRDNKEEDENPKITEIKDK